MTMADDTFTLTMTVRFHVLGGGDMATRLRLMLEALRGQVELVQAISIQNCVHHITPSGELIHGLGERLHVDQSGKKWFSLHNEDHIREVAEQLTKIQGDHHK
jgi:hypothetical protein